MKTPAGFVIEFQHSPISLEERTSREDFYKNMCWVVDATRLKSDAAKFNRAPTLRNLQYPTLLSENVPINFFFPVCLNGIQHPLLYFSILATDFSVSCLHLSIVLAG